MEKVVDIYNYRPVDSKLSTSGQPSEAQLAAAAREGFEVVINLALHNDPRYSLHDEIGVVRSLGMEYVHIPVQFAAPAEVDLLAFFAAIEKFQEKKTLVHCAANKRVTAFFGLYRAIKQKSAHAEAFALMKSVWEPDPAWSSFIAAMLAKHHG
ncbi:MAG: protein tyrosine phosphatase family protein [Gammaproteobacteria bacterium]|nr:protein tyrosine phosphatase family protein [Gammaproteobacteria bacterium]